MKIVLVANQKGGSGKSFISDELLFDFERHRIPASFIDLDGQGGVIHEMERRDDAQAAVVDTPGALQPQMGAWMHDADLIIIPTRTSSRDIQPLLRMAEAVRTNAPETPVLYVINGVTRYRVSRDFTEWFEGQFAGAETVSIPYSERVMQAGALGRSVADYAKGSPVASAVLDLCSRVRSMLGLVDGDPEKVDL